MDVLAIVAAVIVGVLALFLFVGLLGGVLLRLATSLVAKVEIPLLQAAWITIVIWVLGQLVGIAMGAVGGLLLGGTMGGQGGGAIAPTAAFLLQLATLPVMVLLGAAILSSKLGIGFGRSLLVLFVWWLLYVALAIVVAVVLFAIFGGAALLTGGGP